MSSPWKKCQQQHWSWRERNITKHCTCTFCCFHPPSSKWAAPGVTRLQISLSSDCPLEENEYRPTQMCCEPLVKWRENRGESTKLNHYVFIQFEVLRLFVFQDCLHMRAATINYIHRQLIWRLFSWLSITCYALITSQRSIRVRRWLLQMSRL